jgi:pimeloyl-ACP methyl ester carboxylesterase
VQRPEQVQQFTELSLKSLFLIISFLLYLFCSTVLAQELPQTIKLKDFNYNPYEATLAASFLGGPPAINFDFYYRQDRSQAPLLEGRDNLNLVYYKGKTGADLVFIIAGWGGAANFRQSQFLGSKINQQGYHVILLPSASHWSFVLGVSEQGLPGYTPRDADEMQKLITKVYAEANVRYKLNSPRFHLLGYSMGAMQASFVAGIERKNLDSKLDKVILINPPLETVAATKVIDSLLAAGDRYTDKEKSSIFGKVLNAGERSIRQNIEIPQFLDGYNFTTEEISWVLGSAFRQGLSEILYTNELIHKNKILKTPVSRGTRTERWNEARSFSFDNYTYQILLPSLYPDLPKEKAQIPQKLIDQIDFENSLYSKEPFLKSDSNIFIFHSEDDFLLTNTGLQWIKNTFGNRAIIFDRGGHVGETWAPEFNQKLFEVLVPQR